LQYGIQLGTIHSLMLVLVNSLGWNKVPNTFVVFENGYWLTRGFVKYLGWFTKFSNANRTIG